MSSFIYFLICENYYTLSDFENKDDLEISLPQGRFLVFIFEQNLYLFHRVPSFHQLSFRKRRCILSCFPYCSNTSLAPF